MTALYDSYGLNIYTSFLFYMIVHSICMRCLRVKCACAVWLVTLNEPLPFISLAYVEGTRDAQVALTVPVKKTAMHGYRQ